MPVSERGLLAAIWLDPQNARLDPVHTEEQVRRWIEGVWGVWELATDELVGDCTVFFSDDHGEWELAYGLRRDRWRRGYATEAVEACVRHGFQHLGLERIVADVDPENLASIRVLEKCGFVSVGGSGTTVLYAVSR